MVAGLNILATGFGVYDHKYFIDQAVHDFASGSGYETSIEFHKVLDY